MAQQDGITTTISHYDAVALVESAGFRRDETKPRWISPDGVSYWQLDEALMIALQRLAREAYSEPRLTGAPPAPFFTVEHLQACEPESLTSRDGITIEPELELDDQGFTRVAVKGDSREAIIDYVRENWGDDDPQWFADYVCDRIEQVGA